MSSDSNIFLGNKKIHSVDAKVKGHEVEINNEVFYKISNVDGMRPFFMSIVSSSDHWFFISSTGGLSLGRKNPSYALFPYYTDDKISESSEFTGSKTILLIDKNEKIFLWEPFSIRNHGIYKTSRNLYKNYCGNKVIFEEINHDLGIVFSYEWNTSDEYGFVRRSKIENTSEKETKVRILDGIQNLLPNGIDEGLQNSTSNLVDAYKKCELEKDCGLGIYSLSAIIVDKAEPSEALKANLVWSIGLENSKKLLSSLQLDDFRQGKDIKEEIDVKAERGAYFLNKELNLIPQGKEEWMIVANVNQNMNNVIKIKSELADTGALMSKVFDSVSAGTQGLMKIVAASDGLQMTSDSLRNARHFANTLFNVMRGGVFDDNYKIEKDDFQSYLQKANHQIYASKASLVGDLPGIFSLNQLKEVIQRDSNEDFKRLALEYLPLRFSRRHGDPSRPWNKFSINTKSEEDGSKILDYQGNWRDIFQNWEALVHSYPEFIEGMISKFLNATTFDGYNPYRVTKDGFDWETIEPDNPWSYIGYWGDHQIIYLLKFLEFIEDVYPNRLEDYFSQELFVYANVPYRIKDYASVLEDPKNTIDFDHESENEIQKKRIQVGSDGALIWDTNGDIYHVNFIEKILATVLAKISNFIPEGGIWMNTQRPEWNDANNALVGNGVSMVTLYYLRRFLEFLNGLLESSEIDSVRISSELWSQFDTIRDAFASNESLLNGKINDTDRKSIVDRLGNAASEYRLNIYENGFSGEKQDLTMSDLKDFVSISKRFLEHSIRANKRPDKLYHAYNLMTVKSEKEISISYLSEMLEGQVSVLSSGYLSTAESIELLDALKASKLFRADQYSYILYPNKTLPRFVVKNTLSEEQVDSSELLKKLVEDGNKQVVLKDEAGGYHFNGNFNNADYLQKALQELPSTYASLVAEDTQKLLDIYEENFDHKSFTGRSGTFFGYEGLGSIYWHMVSKLRLAAFEVTAKSVYTNEDPKAIGRLFDHYFEIKAGIGAHKSPKLYGAFPTDPYSHTPEGRGAQQPGMTGQVKEDILSRFGEIGVKVQSGCYSFHPVVLDNSEFLSESTPFAYYDIHQSKQTIVVEQGCLAFTVCQVLVLYKKSDRASIDIHYENGEIQSIDGNQLDEQTSKEIYTRTGKVRSLTVHILRN